MSPSSEPWTSPSERPWQKAYLRFRELERRRGEPGFVFEDAYHLAFHRRSRLQQAHKSSLLEIVVRCQGFS